MNEIVSDTVPVRESVATPHRCTGTFFLVLSAQFMTAPMIWLVAFGGYLVGTDGSVAR